MAAQRRSRSRRHQPKGRMFRFRGEICIGLASFFCLAAVILLIFAHLGQTSLSTVPRDISMVKVNMSDYGNSLQTAIGDPVTNLYTSSPTAPLQQAAGLRQEYKFGLYSYCAYVNAAQGICSNTTAAFPFQPFGVILKDMSPLYNGLTQNFINNTLTFTNSHYLGQFSHAAYYLLLLGTICAGLALILGIFKHTWAFLLSTLFAMLGTFFILIGVVIWTVIINKAQSINNALVEFQNDQFTHLGIIVSTGNGLWLFWAAFVCMLVSVLPYMISCCTYRG